MKKSDNFETQWTQYRIWMQRKVKMTIGHAKLLTMIHEIPFRSSVARDRNRILDALAMRRRFCHRFKIQFELADSEICDGSCSVLELLVSFAERVGDEWVGDDETANLFFKFLVNLDIAMEDSIFDKERVKTSLSKWMPGNIRRNGEGGLFPLYKHPEVDQRNKELWIQMMPWLNENYRF